MKVVLQRVNRAQVEVNQKVVGKIDKGLLLLVGFTEGDNKEKIDYIINKIINLRIFNDEDNVMNLSIKDVGGSILSVSQFTLYAETKKGNRPSYNSALSGDKATILYEYFNNKMREYISVEEGIFGSKMNISLENNGPVTIILER